MGDRIDLANTLTYDIGDVGFNFDKIGNFTHLNRTVDTDLDINGITPILVNEEWDYNYLTGTNQLENVTGLGTTLDRNYTYDTNGNLTSDDFRELNGITYTRATYPYHIEKMGGEIDYLYNVGDLRMYKKSGVSSVSSEEYYLKSASGQDLGILDIQNNNWTWYVNGADRIAKVLPKANQQPDSISITNGITDNSINEQFYLYDHLGNTRVVYTVDVRPTLCDLEYTIEYAGDYYPYGKILREYANGEVEKFLTTQHERDLETGLDYRGARFYDSDVARFLSLDPLARDFGAWSPYSYVLGNPVQFVDPNGKEPDGDPIKKYNRLIRRKNAAFGITNKNRRQKAQNRIAKKLNKLSISSRFDNSKMRGGRDNYDNLKGGGADVGNFAGYGNRRTIPLRSKDAYRANHWATNNVYRDPSGTLVGERIGNIGDMTGPNKWVEGNAYGQLAGSDIRIGENNSILDNTAADPNTVLLEVPSGYDVNTDEIVLPGGIYTYYREDGTGIEQTNSSNNVMVIRTVTVEITPQGSESYRIQNSSNVTEEIDK